MKKEQNRYFLVEYCGIRKSVYDTREELDNALERVRLFNNRVTSKFIVGNMQIVVEDGKYALYAHLYNKLTRKATITEIDNYTSKFDEKGLIVDLFDKLISSDSSRNKNNISYYPDINIAYFEDKNQNERDDSLIRKIEYIPVLYRDDKRYLDSKFIDNCIRYHAFSGDLDFFRKLVVKFGFNRSLDKKIDRLVNVIGRAMYDYNCLVELYDATMSIYAELIYERDRDGSISRDENGAAQISRRRQRDFGFFVKNYNSTKVKEPTIYSYRNNKTRLKEMKELRDRLLKEKEKESENKLSLKK